MAISFIGCKENTADEENGNSDNVTSETTQEDKTLNEIIEEESTEANYDKSDAKVIKNKQRSLRIYTGNSCFLDSHRQK